MKIIIVGAGIAGLSLAISLAQSRHRVLILDSAAQLAEIGAGIQMTPQAIRHLFKWGLREDILAECFIPSRMHFKDWKDGRLLGSVHLDDMERQYGAPYIVIHRAVLHSVLHRHAVRAGAELMLDSRVTAYHFEDGAVELHNGKRLEADLVVAADGINSSARAQLLGAQDPGSQPTGWAAFRLMAEVSKVRADPATAGLADLNTMNSNLWLAPHKSVMLYHLTLTDKTQMLNIVLSHHDDVDTSEFSSDDYKRVVSELSEGFEYPVRRLMELSLPKIANYPVYAVPPLPRWTHDSGRFTLMGDAAHAMAFYLSMGVSLAVEDAASLTEALDRVGLNPEAHAETSAPLHPPNETALKRALQIFETVRKRRCRAVQEASLRTGNTMHQPEGEDRHHLYESLRSAHHERCSTTPASDKGDLPRTSEPIDGTGGNMELGPGGIADLATRNWCYAYDAVADIRAYQSVIE